MTSATRSPQPASRPSAPPDLPAAEGSSEAADHPIFVAPDGRRARRLRLAGRLLAGLVGLWVLALLAGALGFGHLPGLNLPRIVGSDHAKTAGPVKRASRSGRRPLTRALSPLASSPAGAGRGGGLSLAGAGRTPAERKSATDSIGSVGTGAPSSATQPGSSPSAPPVSRPGVRRGQATTPSAQTTPAAGRSAPGQTRKTAPSTSTTTAPTTSPGSSGTSPGQAKGHTKTPGG